MLKKKREVRVEKCTSGEESREAKRRAGRIRNERETISETGYQRQYSAIPSGSIIRRKGTRKTLVLKGSVADYMRSTTNYELY